jgi:uncharacterized protein YdeI (YjbR/CyaY-like superfamily)
LAFIDLERFRPESRRAWRRWLQQQHATSSGVLLVFAKKHTRLPTLSYNDAVEEALCFGWIDSTKYPVDGDFYMHAFTPRKPKSVWSALNRERVARLVEQNLMMPSGLRMIELAKRTGTWTAHAHVETLTMPPDLQRALAANRAAKNAWPALPPGRRKMFLYYLSGAKRPQTRATRIGDIVARVAAAAEATKRRPATKNTKGSKVSG